MKTITKVLLTIFLTTLSVCNSAWASGSAEEIAAANQRLQSFLADHKVDVAYYYCAAGATELACRTLYTMQTKAGEKVDGFYVTFMAGERQTGSAGYFLPEENGSGLFSRLEDFTFDGKRIITDIEAPVTVDRHPEACTGSILTIKNFRVNVLGSTKYAIADIDYRDDVAVLDGWEYDSANPDHKVKRHLEYKRVSP
jgi:hypothetical protein